MKGRSRSGTPVYKYFYAGGVQVVKMQGGSVYYLHQDALESSS